MRKKGKKKKPQLYAKEETVRIVLKEPVVRIVNSVPKGFRNSFVQYIMTKVIRSEVGRQWIMEYAQQFSEMVEERIMDAIYQVVARTDGVKQARKVIGEMKSMQKEIKKHGKLGDAFTGFIEE